MRIQHNIMAMNAYRNLSYNNNALSGNLEKLSSGYKINRAGDDAAGLAISEKMRKQITGLDVAQDNAQSGINLVQTAEGALTEVHDMLNRMYELAEQSSNGTMEDGTDRKQIQKEVVALKDEIDRISQSTNFNGINLLDGTAGKGTVGIGAASTLKVGEHLGAAATTTVTEITGTLKEGTYTFEVGFINKEGKFSALTQPDQGGLNSITTIQVSFEDEDGNVTVKNIDVEELAKNTGGKEFNTAVGAVNTIKLGDLSITVANSATINSNLLLANLDGLTVVGDTDGTAAGSSLKLQIGDTAEEYNQLELDIDSTSVESLELTNVNLETQQGALDALKVIEDAINKVSDVRGGLGAAQNRLEHTINNLAVTQENIQEAESTIRDTDVADEMMEYTKNNILIQSAQAMLAQANQAPQGVLQLLQ